VTDAAWPLGVGLRRFDTLDSTSEEAKRLARSGERGPFWIVAREQTAGHGRRGREWVSRGGNLFATLLLEAPAATSAQLCFAAGLAAGETVAAYAPNAEVTLKWPNDVLLNGKKTAGILLEQEGPMLAIGVGINLASHPEGTEFPATSVNAVAKAAPDAEAALHRLAGRMAAWYEVWRTEGFWPVRDAWLARAACLGKEIRARLTKGEVTGVFEDMDGDGALILRGPEGVRRITAADIFF
jgi:BirA family biotin operon repressor/biotin-[acetyl-CoA-carboxylase] ligase